MFGLTAYILKCLGRFIPSRKAKSEEDGFMVKFPDVPIHPNCKVWVDAYDPGKIRATIMFDGSEYDLGNLQDGTQEIGWMGERIPMPRFEKLESTEVGYTVKGYGYMGNGWWYKKDGSLKIIQRHGFPLLPHGYYARKKKQAKRYKHRGVKNS